MGPYFSVILAHTFRLVQIRWKLFSNMIEFSTFHVMKVFKTVTKSVTSLSVTEVIFLFSFETNNTWAFRARYLAVRRGLHDWLRITVRLVRSVVLVEEVLLFCSQLCVQHGGPSQFLLFVCHSPTCRMKTGANKATATTVYVCLHKSSTRRLCECSADGKC